jgi:hypothetical protein
MNKTGRAFVDHWNWAAEKGILNSNTAGALRAACTKVLEIEDNWEAQDVTTLDIDSLLRRFQTLKAKEYKPESLREYDRRFRKAYAAFLEYVESPQTWKMNQQERPARAPKAEVKRIDTPANGGSTLNPLPQSVGFMEYPFPLREGRIVKMSLPTDLKASEVKRLSAFLTTLVLESDVQEIA